MTTDERSVSNSEVPAPKRRERLLDVERLKGFAIVLVVWGHVFRPDFPYWLLAVRNVIYQFHMPLFMFLSGYVFVYAGAHVLKGSVGSYIAKRSSRILLPFLVMAAIVIAGKAIAQNFISVRGPVDNIGSSILRLIINTEQSPAVFIWYLAVLFAFNIVTSLLYSKAKSKIWQIFIISVLLYFFHINSFYAGRQFDFLYANRFAMYYVFFVAGCLAAQNMERWLAFVTRYWAWFLVPFAVAASVLFLNEWRYLVVGLISVPLLFGIVRLPVFQGDTALQFLGQHSFAIYLLNMPFVGLVQGVLERVIDPVANGLLIVAVTTVAAVAGPIAVKLFLAAVPPLRPIAKAIE